MKLLTIITAVLLGAIPTLAQQQPIDKKATPETRQLLHNMAALLDKGVILGHQDDLAYGMQWAYKPGESDVKRLTGQYPGVFGWELGRLEKDSTHNLDGVPFDSIAVYMKWVYENGGINTFSWHFNDPVTKATAWSTNPNTVKSIIPGGAHHAAYKAYLDKLAVYLHKIKDDKGEGIPLLFRPFHEHTGNWFWWGKSSCTPEEFKAIWQFTVTYLRDVKQLHNLLYAYSAADFATEKEYLERYPGDAYVDVLGFDAYCNKDVAHFVKDLNNRLSILQQIAAAHHKVPALTEVGNINTPQAEWWTKTFGPVLEKYKMSYALFWRNGPKEGAFIPYEGQVSAADFIKFATQPPVILLNRLQTTAVYKK